ncbi:F0F1 ATP synthase subunit epsilon [uncultured Eubacterium sp.]|uniref:FoF1 ATP synthase subunit delta/epsilon n=1 Tax=uncultured Eubacterium sp. TaxID=165185 RepID=UPI0025E43991|nr:F0F1 ATP synthase subunit epsilon [uncultured Eubacterium sp.]
MNTFKLKIVSSNRVFFDGEAQSLVVPVAGEGLCGFLARHENTVAPIEFGEMKLTDADGNVTEAFVGSGFLEFINNQANLVCISVELPEEIDKRRAEEAAERAAEELRQQKSINEYYVTQANLSRAMERLKIKNKHQI